MSSITPNFIAKQKSSFFELELYKKKAFITYFNKKQGKVSVTSFQQKGIDLIQKKYPKLTTNIGAKVNEYGGGSFVMGNNTGDFCFFVSADDGQIYSYKLQSPYTTEKLTNIAFSRFADLVYCKKRKLLFAVCEDKKNHKISIISYSLKTKKIQKLLDSRDAYSGFCFSFDEKIAWLEWSFPNMAWDSCELWCGYLSKDNKIIHKKRITHENESALQPAFDSYGRLFFISDRSNWWNLYVLENEKIRACYAMNAEFAACPWVFRMSHYGFLAENKIACSFLKDAYWHFAILDLNKKKLKTIKKFANIQCLKTENESCIFLASSPEHSLDLYYYHLKKGLIKRKKDKIPFAITIPKSIYFDSDKTKVQAFFYETKKPKGLLVKLHGGPTGFSDAGLDWNVQYWVSKGFCYLDINYRGSTGMGRIYRNLLYDNWGIFDVEDIFSALQHLPFQFSSIILKGGSAGALSVLCALSKKPEKFSAAICYYPVSDPKTLLATTHKFELGYLKKLLGKRNQAKDLWDVEKIKHPLIIFQGKKDKVVTAKQTKDFVKNLKKNKVCCELHLLENEGHGFRDPKSLEKIFLLEEKFLKNLL